MRFIKTMLFGLAFVSLLSSASVTNPENGKEFKTMARPQPVEPGKKIEVIEFFAYYCPHCFMLEPEISAWVKKQGDNISYKRVHVTDPRVVTHQKLFFALDALNKVEELNLKVFQAFHLERNRLATDADVIDFAVKSGIDKQKFTDAYNSFSSQSKISRATQLMGAYQVDGWPLIAIDGRFVTSPAMVGQGMSSPTEQAANLAVLSVMDTLVAKAQKDKSGAAVKK